MWPLKTIEKVTYNSFERTVDKYLPFGNKKVYIWGASVRGYILAMILDKKGVLDFSFIDNDINKQGKEVNGHKIFSKDVIDYSESLIFISMEYQEAVVNYLFEKGLVEGINYIRMFSNDSEEYIKAVLESRGKNLVIGASAIHVIPADDKYKDDLADILLGQSDIDAIGVTCLGMKQVYLTLLLLLKINPALEKVAVFVSWETLTSFHHLLPRTQKCEIIRRLVDVSKQIGCDKKIVDELKNEYEKALSISEEYMLENAKCPDRVNGEISVEERLKLYVENSILEPLEKSCVEIIYLTKIVDYLSKNDKEVCLIFEPINKKKGSKLFGECYFKTIAEKIEIFKDYFKQYDLKYCDCSLVGDEEEFSCENTINEALYYSGRQKIALNIYKTLAG